VYLYSAIFPPFVVVTCLC